MTVVGFPRFSPPDSANRATPRLARGYWKERGDARQDRLRMGKEKAIHDVCSTAQKARWRVSECKYCSIFAIADLPRPTCRVVVVESLDAMALEPKTVVRHIVRQLSPLALGQSTYHIFARVTTPRSIPSLTNNGRLRYGHPACGMRSALNDQKT